MLRKLQYRWRSLAREISDSAWMQQLAAPLAARGTDSAAHEAGTFSTGKERNRQVRGEHPFLPHTHTLCSSVYSSTRFIYCCLFEAFTDSFQKAQRAGQPVRSRRFSCRDAAVAQTFGKQFVPGCNTWLNVRLLSCWAEEPRLVPLTSTAKHDSKFVTNKKFCLSAFFLLVVWM